MTLKDLIEQAQKLLDSGTSPDTPVYTEGCDCDGAAGELSLTKDNGGTFVLVTRFIGN